MFKKIQLSLLLATPLLLQIYYLKAESEMVTLSENLIDRPDEQGCYDDLDKFIDMSGSDLSTKTVAIPQGLKNFLVKCLLGYLAMVEYCSNSWHNIKGKFKKKNELSH